MEEIHQIPAFPTSHDLSSHEKKPYGVYPYQKKRRLWEYFIYFLGMVCLWELPFEWFFNMNRPYYYVLPALIIDIFFAIDIYIVKHTGVIEYGIIRLDKKSIESRLPRWKIIIYCLSIIPYYLIGWFADNDIAFRVLVSLKALRLLRIYDAEMVIKNTLVYISSTSRMIILFCQLFTIVNLCACIFWYVGHVEIPGESWLIETGVYNKPPWDQYFHVIYYITTTVLTIGYGDLHPYTFAEVCVVIFVEVFGVLFYNFLISNMVSIIADPSRNIFLNKFKRIYSVFKSRGVSDLSMQNLLQYYEYIWETDRDRADFYEATSKMPLGLQKRLELALHMDIFNRVEVFNGASEEALEKIALALKPRIFTPGDHLVKAGRVSERMFFIVEGTLDLITPSGALVATVDGLTGAVIGENSMMNDAEEQASAIASTYVEAYELDKKDFQSIADLHPILSDPLLGRSQADINNYPSQ